RPVCRLRGLAAAASADRADRRSAALLVAGTAGGRAAARPAHRPAAARGAVVPRQRASGAAARRSRHRSARARAAPGRNALHGPPRRLRRSPPAVHRAGRPGDRRAVRNRPRRELEPLIGFFVSSLPLRARLTDDPGAATLIARLRTETLGAAEHRDVPAGGDPLFRHPLFRTMLAVEDSAIEPPALSECTAEIIPLSTGTAKLDLTLALAASGAELAGELEISADLFEPATAERLIGHFTSLLHGLVDDPGQPVSRLPLLTAAERAELTRQAGGGAARGSETCLHDLVLAQAERSADAVAVESGDESLTYRELRERATLLAAHLRAIGIGPDVPVGLCAERTPALAAG